jgi:menaquinol-cytochrome c reductase iron-sulfur subunit
MSASPSPPLPSAPSADDRRGFFAKFSAVVIGGLLVVCPFLAGLSVFADPLRRKGGNGQFLRVARLDALPADGKPRRFPVIADRRDAWTKHPPAPIGAVYLRRDSGQDKVEAFNVICPHLGCSVSFDAPREIFQCPCHTSAFDLEGDVLSGPSPRGLDTLPCEVRDDGSGTAVWVKFENFFTGRTAKDPKA